MLIKEEPMENINYYKPSRDEMILADDILNLVNVIFDCDAKWRDKRKLYQQFRYGVETQVFFEKGNEEYYVIIDVIVRESEAEICIKNSESEVIGSHIYKNDKPFARGQIVDEIVDLDNISIEDIKENNTDSSNSTSASQEEEIYEYSVAAHDFWDRIENYMPSKDEILLANRVLAMIRERCGNYEIYWHSQREAVAGLSRGYEIEAVISEDEVMISEGVEVSLEMQKRRAVISFRNINMPYCNEREEVICFEQPFVQGQLTHNYVPKYNYPLKMEGGKPQQDKKSSVNSRMEREEQERAEYEQRQWENEERLREQLEHVHYYRENFGTESTMVSEEGAWDEYYSNKY